MKIVFLKLGEDTFESVNEIGVTTREVDDAGTNMDTTYYIEYNEESDKLLAYEVVERQIFIDKFIELDANGTYEVIDIIEDTRSWQWAQEKYESSVVEIGMDAINTKVVDSLDVNEGDDIDLILARTQGKVLTEKGKNPPRHTTRRRQSSSDEEEEFKTPVVDLSKANMTIEEAIEAAAKIASDEAKAINGEDETTRNHDVEAYEEPAKPVKRATRPRPANTKKQTSKKKRTKDAKVANPPRTKRNNPAPRIKVDELFEDDADLDENWDSNDWVDDEDEREEWFDEDDVYEDDVPEVGPGFLSSLLGGKANRSTKRNKKRRPVKPTPRAKRPVVASGDFGNITAVRNLDSAFLESFVFKNAQLLLALQNMDDKHMETILGVIEVLAGGSDKNINLIFA